jgi:hypothetical protein
MSHFPGVSPLLDTANLSVDISGLVSHTKVVYRRDRFDAASFSFLSSPPTIMTIGLTAPK